MDYTNELIPYTSIDYYRDKLKRDEVKIHLLTLEQETTPQSHDTVHFIYVTAGAATLEINGQASHFKAGQLVILMAYHIFKLKPLAETSCTYYVCQFSIGLLLLSTTSKTRYQESLMELDRGIPIVSLLADEQQEMVQYCQKLALPTPEAFSWANDLRILSAITSITYLFLQGLARRKASAQDAMTLPWQVLQYIHFHHQKKLSLNDVATTFQVAPSTVTHYLQQLTQMSFAQNLTRVRLINATALLEFHALSINQISRIVGFQSDAYFYREFKKIHQVTPQVYRQAFSSKLGPGIEDDGYDVFMYIYEHYQQPLTVVAIATALSLTPKRVSQLVADMFHLSVAELLNKIRCAVARGLMLETDWSLSRIAERVGFNDSKQFRRYFKYFYQKTPSDYRHAHTSPG